MMAKRNVAIFGAGVIGSSWAALFLAKGWRVTVYDPAPDTEHAVRQYVAKAQGTLDELGLVENQDSAELRFCRDLAKAVEDADFVQENVPERIRLKHEVYAAIEPALKADAIVASSASGLRLSELQAGWQDPSRLVLGHPFNPPHLIPLVEIMGNQKTGAGVVDAAEALYRSLGKVTIRVNKEVPGHVANRLQAALWREAIHLMSEGVASVKDIDTAVWAGPGLRWAAMGPTMLFHLGAGKGGLGEFCERYADSFHRWWDDLGTVKLDQDTARQLIDGVAEEARNRSWDGLCEKRDELIVALLKSTSNLRR
jgi:3-hydroxybutyryl-CoA dehydrogenase